MAGKITMAGKIKQISRQNKNAVIMLSDVRLMKLLPKLNGHLQTILTKPMDKIDVSILIGQNLAFGNANFKINGKVKPLFVLAEAPVARNLKIFQTAPAYYAGKHVKATFLGFKSLFDGVKWKKYPNVPGTTEPITLYDDQCGNFMEYEGGVHKVHFQTGKNIPMDKDNNWEGWGTLSSSMFKSEKVDK